MCIHGQISIDDNLYAQSSRPISLNFLKPLQNVLISKAQLLLICLIILDTFCKIEGVMASDALLLFDAYYYYISG